ncbi:MAG TPA: LysM peptidoglycan-binding domain-containing protein [Phaeodactylibacter sp.]|nr:LysM peptidoglycan-binding domain-containing protein [Phaeodactylibacter sp.]
MSLNKTVIFFVLILFFGIKVSSQNPTTTSSYTPVPVFSDQELEARIKNLSSLAVTPHLDRVVKSYIKTYSVLKRDRTERMLGKAVLYFPIFEKYLLENNMPADIKYLSVVESALNPEAISRVGAGGLWQFMPGTGKEYGLKINSKIDERRDPHKSTKAAIKYLKRLYDKYQNWELALAAYNSGPGRVNRAIRRGKSKNFWKIKKYLPRETRNYVPAFVAANYIVNNYHLHYLSPQYPELDMQLTDYTRVYRSISFREISEITGTPIFIIQSLNPSFKQGIIPSSRNGYYLTLPKRNMPAFLRAFPSPDSRNNGVNGGRLEYFKSLYYVQPGDNIDKLAKLFNCHRRHIMAWNNLPQPYLTRGQELVIYQISNSVSVHVEKLPPISQKLEKTQLKEETILSASPKKEKVILPQKKEILTPENKQPVAPKPSFKYHYIRRNESILDIIEQYDGVSIQDILELNHIKGNNLPSVGTRLKIIEN